MPSGPDESKRKVCKVLVGQALEQLRSALRSLDDAGAPGDIGAHVDLAINRVEGLLLLQEN